MAIKAHHLAGFQSVSPYRETEVTFPQSIDCLHNLELMLAFTWGRD
jgi:hypothetical protein